MYIYDLITHTCVCVCVSSLIRVSTDARCHARVNTETGDEVIEMKDVRKVARLRNVRTFGARETFSLSRRWHVYSQPVAPI